MLNRVPGYLRYIIIHCDNRPTRQETSEGKLAIDWLAECTTYQRLSSERTFFHLLACTRRSNSRARSSDGGGAS